MADHDDAPEKIKCLECGKEFSFLAPHLSKAHQMNARQYRERWGIPLHMWDENKVSSFYAQRTH